MCGVRGCIIDSVRSGKGELLTFPIFNGATLFSTAHGPINHWLIVDMSRKRRDCERMTLSTTWIRVALGSAKRWDYDVHFNDHRAVVQRHHVPA